MDTTTTSSETTAAALQESLSKIRHHTSSKLDNQRAPALLLQAIEDGLTEHLAASTGAGGEGEDSSASASVGQSKHARNTQIKPTEYLLAMLSMAPQALSENVSPSPPLFNSPIY
jgi:ribosomal RNA-processing protein 12